MPSATLYLCLFDFGQTMVTEQRMIMSNSNNNQINISQARKAGST